MNLLDENREFQNLSKVDVKLTSHFASGSNACVIELKRINIVAKFEVKLTKIDMITHKDVYDIKTCDSF